MIEWDDLRYFLAIARHHTLTGAARALGVQQSTMGRRLDSLEERAGVKLLHRTPSGFVLTSAGEAIFANVERIEDEALAVERAIAGKDGRLEGPVRVTAVEKLTADFVAPLLGEFAATYPDIMLDLVTEARSLNLARGEAEIALRMARFRQNDIAARLVARLPVGLFASADYIERHGLPDFSRDAQDHRVLLMSEPWMSLPEMVWFSGLAGQAQVAMRANSRNVLIKAAKAGIGILCIEQLYCEGSGLVAIEPPAEPPTREVWLGIHNDMRAIPRIRAVAEFLATGLRRQLH